MVTVVKREQENKVSANNQNCGRPLHLVVYDHWLCASMLLMVFLWWLPCNNPEKLCGQMAVRQEHWQESRRAPAFRAACPPCCTTFEVKEDRVWILILPCPGCESLGTTLDVSKLNFLNCKMGKAHIFICLDEIGMRNRYKGHLGGSVG